LCYCCYYKASKCNKCKCSELRESISRRVSAANYVFRFLDIFSKYFASIVDPFSMYGSVYINYLF
jgi:hypothetical protein